MKQACVYTHAHACSHTSLDRNYSSNYLTPTEGNVPALVIFQMLTKMQPTILPFEMQVLKFSLESCW